MCVSSPFGEARMQVQEGFRTADNESMGPSHARTRASKNEVIEILGGGESVDPLYQGG